MRVYLSRAASAVAVVFGLSFQGLSQAETAPTAEGVSKVPTVRASCVG